jgi:hypothetical protein
MAQFKVLSQDLPEGIWEHLYAFSCANFVTRNIPRTFFLDIKVLQKGLLCLSVHIRM